MTLLIYGAPYVRNHRFHWIIECYIINIDVIKFSYIKFKLSFKFFFWKKNIFWLKLQNKWQKMVLIKKKRKNRKMAVKCTFLFYFRNTAWYSYRNRNVRIVRGLYATLVRYLHNASESHTCTMHIRFQLQ